MANKTYWIFQFPVNDFLEFTGQPRKNSYQTKKLVEFLKSLQKMAPVLEKFSDGGFQSYIAFSYLKVERKEGWCVELSLC